MPSLPTLSPEEFSEFVSLLRCPVSGQSLRPASVDELSRLNAMVAVPMGTALIRQDQTVAYPVRNGIPALLPEHGIMIAD